MPSQLLSPLPLRGLSLPNRIAVSPMCQYMARDGLIGDWHLVHLGQFAQGGAGLVMVEATGVTPAARITPGCPGLWSDEQEAAFARVLAFARSVGEARMGIQLAHAGRKASTAAPWDGAGPVTDEAGWETEAPSAVPYLPTWPTPRALDEEGIAAVIDAFAQGARRAVRAGFDLVEVHAAHGYLLHEFLSPLSNHRADRWGGDLEGRMRLPLAVVGAVRAAIPEGMPLLVRISATDWVEGGWDLDEAVELCRALREAGCDMVDVSSGGLDQRQKIPVGPGYQVPLSARIRAEAGMPTMAVGMITDPVQAETIVASGQADAVAIARAMLWDPRWAWHAAEALGGTIAPPAPYARAHPSLRGQPFITRS